MLEYTQGNLLEAKAEALVNTVNCVGVMGKGIALQFKKAFPDNFHHYEKACRNKQVQPGRMFIVSTDSFENPRYIINFPTKFDWRGKSKLKDIRAGLEALVKDVERLGIRSIAIPPLGCGNGGLKWADVSPLIEAAFAKLPDVRVIVFEPHGAPRAEEMPISAKKPKMTRARALLIRLMDLYRIPGYRLSLLEVQKLAYFLQLAGEPLKLRYMKRQYGPYADNLNHVLQALDEHFIKGYGDRTRRAEIYPLPDGVEDARLFLADFPDAGERLEKVRKLIEGFESPYGLELLSTVAWVAQETPMAAYEVDYVIPGVRKWSKRKEHLFKPDHIQKAWQRLKDEGWLAGS
jgi:O-acetyl-ADP-ribose deacetylase (regulator of RNase III)